MVLATDRLRRLDALFAERVLGLIVEDGRIATGRTYPPHHKDLPHYTRSLDAAWEATNDGWCCRQVNGDFNFVYAAEVVRHHGHGDHEKFTAQAECHPAEALVLACLRAVGVPEDELV